MKRYIILILLIVVSLAQLQAQTLSLDSCKYFALEHNKKIKEAKLKVNESEEVAKNAYTNFFPKVDAQAFAMKSNDYLLDVQTPEMNLPVYDGNPANLATAAQFAYVPSMNIQSLDYLNVGMVTATQPLYAGGRVRSGYKLASLGEKINEESLVLTTQQVVVKTEEYYWTLVSLNAKLNTLSSYEKMLTSLLKDVQVSYDAGLIQKSDLLKVQLKINEIHANKLKLNNGIELTKMALCQHIGIPYSDSLMVADTTFTDVLPQSLYARPEAALVNRSEYQMLNKAIDAQILQKRLARGEFMPQLAVGVMGQYLDVADKQNTYGIAFATLKIPISDWWGGSHKLQEQKIKIAIAKNNLDEKSELLKLQMEKTYKELTESYQQITVAKSLEKEAREHLKVVADNHEAGIMSTSDLLEAQATFQQAEDGLVNAQSTYQICQVYYKQAIAKLSY